MSSTPQKGFSVAAWNKLQRDLNSPSASCRIRAIRAIKYDLNTLPSSDFLDHFEILQSFNVAIFFFISIVVRQMEITTVILM